MKSELTPRQIATAIRVSESSIKRWCDKGKIQTSYTAGGHRRIPINAILTFLRSSKHDLINPQAIGLPERSNVVSNGYEETLSSLVDAMVNGNETLMRQTVVELFLAEESIPKILDDYIAAAFHKIGSLWECGQVEVFQERRACEMSVRILNEVRAVSPGPSVNSPLAIGASPAGDLYRMPSMMVEVVLRNANWNATSMGENVPLESLAVAVRTQRPKLFWLSVSHVESEDQFVADYQNFYNEFAGQLTFVVGGRRLTEELRQRIKFSAYCSNMQELDSFIKSIPIPTSPMESPGLGQ
jgi:methanogenic corrinoid protein MtbC1